MGASNHPTTRVETDDEDVRYNRLKADLAECDGIENVRESMLAGLVVETDERGFDTDALGVLNEHGARIGTNKGLDDPFEVFLE